LNVKVETKRVGGRKSGHDGDVMMAKSVTELHQTTALANMGKQVRMEVCDVSSCLVTSATVRKPLL